jgi:nicotinamidase/pyrazinamidase
MKQNSALILVDMQYDFCPGGSLEVPEGDKVIPVANRISSLFSTVVASQDWHPEEHVSFASQHTGKNPFDTTKIDGREWTLWPDHCMQGTKGAELHDELDTTPVRLILRKGMQPRLDSYSVFFENDTKTTTGLASYLQGMGITEVYLCGLATDVCVYFSAMDAIRLGFSTHLVGDACAGIDQPEGSLDEALDHMKEIGVHLLTSGEIE